MPSIQSLLSAHLADSPGARLDAQWLLAAVLGKPRSYLYAWPQECVTEAQAQRFAQYLERRQAGEPVAYILGRQGFYNLDLTVNAHSLIPRADTETLVEACLQRLPATARRVLDLGSGSGAIALALAKERPDWQLVGVDKSQEAVQLAEVNRRQLQLANARFLRSDWFSAVNGGRFAAIVSNPPYIAANDAHLSQGDLRFEPRTALVSGADGLDDLRHICRHAPAWLEKNGWLLLEHGWQQADAVRELLTGNGFTSVESLRDLGGNWRVSLGRLPC